MTVAAVPAGVATAVFLTEYAPADSKLARVIRVCIAKLPACHPSCSGFSALAFSFPPSEKGSTALFTTAHRLRAPSLIWASLTLAILTLPVVVVATEEALRAVPREIRDASWRSARPSCKPSLKVVLPEALAGVLTGTILAISRGAGEVAPIMFTGVAYFLTVLPDAHQRQFMSLSYHV